MSWSSLGFCLAGLCFVKVVTSVASISFLVVVASVAVSGGTLFCCVVVWVALTGLLVGVAWIAAVW